MKNETTFFYDFSTCKSVTFDMEVLMGVGYAVAFVVFSLVFKKLNIWKIMKKTVKKWIQSSNTEKKGVDPLSNIDHDFTSFTDEETDEESENEEGSSQSMRKDKKTDPLPNLPCPFMFPTVENSRTTHDDDDDDDECSFQEKVNKQLKSLVVKHNTPEKQKNRYEHILSVTGMFIYIYSYCTFKNLSFTGNIMAIIIIVMGIILVVRDFELHKWVKLVWKRIIRDGVKRVFSFMQTAVMRYESFVDKRRKKREEEDKKIQQGLNTRGNKGDAPPWLINYVKLPAYALSTFSLLLIPHVSADTFTWKIIFLICFYFAAPIAFIIEIIEIVVLVHSYKDEIRDGVKRVFSFMQTAVVRYESFVDKQRKKCEEEHKKIQQGVNTHGNKMEAPLWLICYSRVPLAIVVVTVNVIWLVVPSTVFAPIACFYFCFLLCSVACEIGAAIQVLKEKIQQGIHAHGNKKEAPAWLIKYVRLPACVLSIFLLLLVPISADTFTWKIIFSICFCFVAPIVVIIEIVVFIYSYKAETKDCIKRVFSFIKKLALKFDSFMEKVCLIERKEKKKELSKRERSKLNKRLKSCYHCGACHASIF